ncbi:hypothetical protein [Chitinophaga sp. OAE865]|uniref:hypothetical protein n=1 Tax=Chitinophaga sp. OAE865 TaxID=2817898 RepID=UPI001AE1BAFA
MLRILLFICCIQTGSGPGYHKALAGFSLNGHLTPTTIPGCGTTAYMQFNTTIMQPAEMQPLFNFT